MLVSPEAAGKAAAGKQRYIDIELLLLSLAFNHYPCLSFSPLVPSVMLGYAERQGLLENIFHKTIPKVETAQVRELMYLVNICACMRLFTGALEQKCIYLSYKGLV